METRWQGGIGKWMSLDVKRWPQGCAQVKADEAAFSKWLQRTEAEFGRHPAPEGAPDKSIFSRYEWRNECTGTAFTTYAEPLAASLRHPFSPPCATPRSRKAVTMMDTDYLMLRRDGTQGRGNLSPTARGRFFFDLGASTYADRPGPNFFIDSYASRGIHFDRILGWEAKSMSAATFFRGMPSEIVSTYTFFNMPAAPGPTNAQNPLRILKQIAKPSDFVVLKLDIDNNDVENEFVRQILASEELQSLIDEMFWEHHVIGSPNWNFKGITTLHDMQNLQASYELFGKLRRTGIVTHAWV